MKGLYFFPPLCITLFFSVSILNGDESKENEVNSSTVAPVKKEPNFSKSERILRESSSLSGINSIPSNFEDLSSSPSVNTSTNVIRGRTTGSSDALANPLESSSSSGQTVPSSSSESSLKGNNSTFSNYKGTEDLGKSDLGNINHISTPTSSSNSLSTPPTEESLHPSPMTSNSAMPSLTGTTTSGTFTGNPTNLNGGQTTANGTFSGYSSGTSRQHPV